MSYELEDEEPTQEPKSTPKSVEPMPRLWKSEPEPTEEESRSDRKSQERPRAPNHLKKSADSKRACREIQVEIGQGEGTARRR